MKAVYVTFDKLDPNSGAGKVCLHEIAALKRVCDTTVISREDLQLPYEFNPFLWDYFAAAKIRNSITMDSSPFDLIHLSCSPGMAILGAAMVSAETKVVCNIVAHDLKESIDAHEKIYGAGSYPFKHNTDPYLHEQLLKHTSYAHIILTPSTAAEKWINANIAVVNLLQVVKVIPHGCDLPNIVAPLPMPEDFKVGYMGAYGPDKGIEYLLDATKDFTLVLAGTISTGIGLVAPTLDWKARNIKTLGWVDQIATFYDQISVYVQPSVTEGFGIEILEAMAHGRPVIASAGAGGADVVTDGWDGFVVPAKDAAAIALRLAFLKEHPEILALMASRARESAAQYTWDKIEERYVRMYQEILHVTPEERLERTMGSKRGGSMRSFLIKMGDDKNVGPINLPFRDADLVLELGCGEKPLENSPLWHTHDYRNLPGITHCFDLEKPFPIADAVYDGVYATFVYEHVTWRKVPHLFSEIFRVLKPGGHIFLVGPNTLEQCRNIVAKGYITDTEAAMIFGGQDEGGWNAHKAAFSPDSLIQALAVAGFKEIVVYEWPIAKTDMYVIAEKSL